MPLIVDSDSACEVCWEEYTQTSTDDLPHVLPCGHVLCGKCGTSLSPPACPLCRQTYRPDHLIRLHIDRPENHRPAGWDGAQDKADAIDAIEQASTLQRNTTDEQQWLSAWKTISLSESRERPLCTTLARLIGMMLRYSEEADLTGQAVAESAKTQLDQAVAEWKGRLEAVERRHSQERAQHFAESGDEEAQFRLAIAQSEATSAREELDSTKRQRDEYAAALDENEQAHSQRMGELRLELIAANTAISANEERKRRAHERVTELETRLLATNEQMSGLQQMMARIHDERKEDSMQRLVLQKQLAAAQHQIGLHKAIIEKDRNGRDDLGKKLMEANLECSELRARLAELALGSHKTAGSPEDLDTVSVIPTESHPNGHEPDQVSDAKSAVDHQATADFSPASIDNTSSNITSVDPAEVDHSSLCEVSDDGPPPLPPKPSKNPFLSPEDDTSTEDFNARFPELDDISIDMPGPSFQTESNAASSRSHIRHDVTDELAWGRDRSAPDLSQPTRNKEAAEATWPISRSTPASPGWRQSDGAPIQRLPVDVGPHSAHEINSPNPNGLSPTWQNVHMLPPSGLPSERARHSRAVSAPVLDLHTVPLHLRQGTGSDAGVVRLDTPSSSSLEGPVHSPTTPTLGDEPRPISAYDMDFRPAMRKRKSMGATMKRLLGKRDG